MTLPYEPDRADAWPLPVEEESSELVQRLRALPWPEVSPDVRQRCWERLRRQLGDFEAPVEETLDRMPSGANGLHTRRFGRHEFASRIGQTGYQGALGHRVAAASRGARPLGR